MNETGRSPRRALAMTGVVVLTLVMMAGVGSAQERATVGTSLRAESVPSGVWSGPGEYEGDYTIVAVMDGPAGSQPMFLADLISGACDQGPAVLFGTARLDGTDLWLRGVYRCVETGEVVWPDFQIAWGGGDLEAYIDPYNAGTAMWTRKCAGANSTMVGTPGDDVLTGTAGNDVIDGLGGNDIIKGKGGWDILCGQGGKDKLIGGGGIDVLVGGGKKDRLKGGSSWDLLLGEGGSDVLNGGGGDDFMFGAGGGDNLIGGGGTDYADGGSGSDACTAETEVSC
jgi:hypothetical protein